MMRIVPVDERDTSVEYSEAPFRVFVYEGPGNAVSAYDVLDCTLDKVLETGRRLAHNDGLIWSLAAVIDTGGEQKGRGLVWLSGMDYNSRPASAAERRRRAEMQDRHLSEKSRRGEAPVLPDGLRVIRMFPEWTVDLPLWESYSDQYPFEPGMLPIPRDLEQELIAWSRAWQSYDETQERPREWCERGLALHARLQAALEGVAEVRPDFDSGMTAPAAS